MGAAIKSETAHGAERREIQFAPFGKLPALLLLTGYSWIHRLLVYVRPMIEIPDRQRQILHENRAARHVDVVNVLRLVGYHVVIRFDARTEIRDRNS